MLLCGIILLLNQGYFLALITAITKSVRSNSPHNHSPQSLHLEKLMFSQTVDKNYSLFTKSTNLKYMQTKIMSNLTESQFPKK